MTTPMDIDRIIQSHLAEVNNLPGYGAPGQIADKKSLPADFEFVSIAETLAKALVKAAEDKLEQANKTLAAARKYAEQLMHDIRSANDNLLQLGARLDAYDASMHNAHTAFHADGKIHESE